MMLQRSGKLRARGLDPAVTRYVVGLVLTAAFSFVAVGSATVYIAKRISRDEVLTEAARTARGIGNSVFAPVLPRVISGDAEAVMFLDRAVRIRSRDGSLVRVKVWTRDGMVIYSDDHALVGQVFQIDEDVRDAMSKQKSSVSVSNLDSEENIHEAGQFDHLVEAYVPLTLDDGTRVVFETYSTDAHLRSAEKQLTGQLVPFALGALLVLLLTQLPVAVWLIRRVARAQQERSRLLRNSLIASERERRAIARDLHDGVVQELAGAGYALGALTRALPSDAAGRTREMLELSSAAVERSVRDLRTLIIDIHPPDMTAGSLQVALQAQAAPLRANGRTEVIVRVSLPGYLVPEVVGLLYRAARECLTNVAKHAAAAHVTVDVTTTDELVQLVVHDDGIGLPADWNDRRAEGHLGVKLLTDAARDLGGEFTLGSPAGGGTTATLVLPTHEDQRD
jgi:signal transduction histidine kinase